MSGAREKPWTPERFLAWAERQEQRYEFDVFQPVAMTGGHREGAGICRYCIRSALRHCRIDRCRPMVLYRGDAADAWTALTRTADDVLSLPAIGAEIPLAELYEMVVFDP